MFITLKRHHRLYDGTIPTRPRTEITVPPGRYEIERVANPFGHEGFWLVLKGTLTGSAEAWFRQWQKEDKAVANGYNPDTHDDWEIIIEE